MNKRTITFESMKSYPVKEAFNYFHVNQPDFQAIAELNKSFSVSENALITSDIPPMAFYDIEVTPREFIPRTKDVKGSQWTQSSLTTQVNQPSLLQGDLLPSP